MVWCLIGKSKWTIILWCISKHICSFKYSLRFSLESCCFLKTSQLFSFAFRFMLFSKSFHRLLHTDITLLTAHTFNVDTAIRKIPQLKKKFKPSHSPLLLSFVFVSIFTLPPPRPLFAVSYGVAPQSPTLSQTALSLWGPIPIPHIAVAWASFTDTLDWQCECPGLMFLWVPKTFSPINHERRKTCQSQYFMGWSLEWFQFYFGIHFWHLLLINIKCYMHRCVFL